MREAYSMWHTAPDNWESLGPPPTNTTINHYVVPKPHRENAFIDALYEVCNPASGHQKRVLLDACPLVLVLTCAAAPFQIRCPFVQEAGGRARRASPSRDTGTRSSSSILVRRSFQTHTAAVSWKITSAPVSKPTNFFARRTSTTGGPGQRTQGPLSATGCLLRRTRTRKQPRRLVTCISLPSAR